MGPSPGWTCSETLCDLREKSVRSYLSTLVLWRETRPGGNVNTVTAGTHQASWPVLKPRL